MDGEGGDEDMVVELGQSLVSACRAGDSEQARGLLVKGAPVNFEEDTRRGWTPLMWASCRGNLDVVEMLVKDFGAAEPYVGSTRRRAQSVPPGRQSRAGAMTPAVLGLRPDSAPAKALPTMAEEDENSEEVVPEKAEGEGDEVEAGAAAAAGDDEEGPHDGLSEKGAEGESRPESTAAGSTATTQRMGMTMNATEGEGINSPLHWAALKGNLGVVQALMRSGLDVHDLDDVGNSALHLACAGGHGAVVKYLLNNGADAHLRNSFGNTPARVANGAATAALMEGVANALVYRGDVSLLKNPRDVLDEEKVWDAIKWRHWKADKTETALCTGPWCSWEPGCPGTGPRKPMGADALVEPVLASVPGAGLMWERSSCTTRVVLTPSDHHKGDIHIPTTYCPVCEGRMVEAERLLQSSIDVEDEKVLDELATAIDHAVAMQADLALIRNGKAMQARLKCERHMKACCVETDACRPPQGRDEIDRLIDSIAQTKAHAGNQGLLQIASVLLYVSEVELDLKNHCDTVRALPLAVDRGFVVECKELIAKGEDCKANAGLLQDMRDLVVRMECEIELVEAALQPKVVQTLPGDGGEVEISIPECTYEWTLKGWKAGGAWEPLPPPPVEGKKPKKAKKPKKRKPPPPLYTYLHTEGGVAGAVVFRSDGPGGTLDSLEYRDNRLTAAQEAGLNSVIPVNSIALARAGEEQLLMSIPRESDGRAGNMGVAKEEDTEKKRKEAILQAKLEKKRLKAEAKAAKKAAKAEKKRLKAEAKAAKKAAKAEKKRLKAEAKAAKAAAKAEAKAAKEAELAAKAAAKAAAAKAAEDGAAGVAAPAAAPETST